MEITKGMKVRAEVKNYNRLHKVDGIVDEVFMDGSYLAGNWYSLIVIGGDKEDKLVEFMASGRIVVIVPENNILEVITDE